MRLKTQLITVMAGVVLLPFLAIGVVARANTDTAFPGEPLLRYMRISHVIAEAVEKGPEGEPVIRDADAIPDWLGLILADVNGVVVYSNVSGYVQGQPLQLEKDLTAWKVESPDSRFFIESLYDDETYGIFLAVLNAPKRNTSMPVSWITLIIAYLGLLAIVGILASIVIGRFGSSVLRLEKAARRIASGDLDTPVTIQGQEELKTLGGTLDEMRINLKEERERRVRFIAAVSHDLKTPLTTISGYLEAFEDGMASDETTASRYLALMKDKAELLDGRVNALLDYARVSTGEWQKTLEYQSLREYLENIGRTYAQDIQMLSMEWETDVAELGDEMVAFDASQLDRVFENLASNAMRYCQPGCRIVLRGLRKNDGLEIVLSDDGPGMKDEDVKRVFEPYYRGEASRQGEGSGLGLFIAHTIVSSHGWTMHVESFPGKGTTFTIHIPRSDQGGRQ